MKIDTNQLRRVVFNPRAWLVVLASVSAVYLIVFLCWLIVFSIDNGVHMSTYPANGTFQLYNPMRRLAMGQIIGLDFPFFHGIGVPLLHYPLFLLLGGGVFAAEVCKWFISPILFLASSYFFFFSYFRNIKKSIIALVLLLAVSLMWVDVIWPGNSLIGVRGVFPILIAGTLLWQTSRYIQIRKVRLPVNELATLILLGCAPIFGTEQGLAAILAYASIQLFIILRDKKHRISNTLKLASKGVLILLVMFATYTIVTGGHPLTAMRYAFFDIPMDQGWYFGTEITGYLKWENALPWLFHPILMNIWIVILVGTISFFFIIKYGDRRHILLPFSFLIVCSIIVFTVSITGYYTPMTQLIPLQRSMSLIAVASVVTLLFNNQTWRWINSNIKRLPIITIPILLISIVLISGIFVKLNAIKSLPIKQDFRLAREARVSNDYFAASSLWKQSIDMFRPYIKPNRTVWSMYTGIYDTTFGNNVGLSHGGEDYIIHALGDKRRLDYQNDFLRIKPNYVITMKPDIFGYEEWLWHNHWEIYKQIFTCYKLLTENSSNYLWEIRLDCVDKPSPTTKASVINNKAILPGNKTALPIVYTVDIDYEALAGIPGTARISRYFIKVDSKQEAQKYNITLPSHKNTWSFPVIVLPGEKNVTISAFVDGIIPNSDIRLLGVKYNQTVIEPSNLSPIINNIPKS
ncbi:MAG: hypothetical protein WAW80_04810 [Candidatus Saccharimonadales bacterium]